MPEPKDGSIEQAVARLMEGSEQSPTPEAEPEQPEAPVEAIADEETEQEETEEEAVEQDVPETEDAEDTSEYEEEDSDEEPEEEGEEPQMYSVVIDGEEYEVSLDELTDGYQRQKDYSKKTQAVAEERKKVESEFEQVAKASEEMQQAISMAYDVLNRDVKELESIDWQALKDSDPQSFLIKQTELYDAKQKQQELVSQYQQNQQLFVQKQQEAFKAAMKDEEPKIFAAFPEWKDAEKAKDGYSKLMDYGRKLGFEDNQLANLYTARELILFDKAMKYDELQTTKKVIKRKQKPVIRKATPKKGAAPKKAAGAKVAAEIKQRARDSGSIQDAAARLASLRAVKAKS